MRPHRKPNFPTNSTVLAMKTMNSTIFLTIFFLTTIPALTSADSVSCPSIITASKNNCSSDIFDSSSSIVTNCTETTLTVSGSFSTISDFDVEANVTAVPFLAGIPFRRYAKSLGNICTLATNDAGDECGTTGAYTLIEGTYDIPNTSFRSMFGSVTIRILIDDQEDCENNSTFLQKMGWAAVPLVGVGLFSYLRQRQRRRPLLVLEGGDAHFVEMKDLPSSGGAMV